MLFKCLNLNATHMTDCKTRDCREEEEKKKKTPNSVHLEIGLQLDTHISHTQKTRNEDKKDIVEKTMRHF